MAESAVDLSAANLHHDDEPHPIWSPIVAGVSLLVPALLALATRQLVLFASLGPTAVMQAHSPSRRSSSLYNVVVGHAAGFAVASAAVLALGLARAPSVFAADAVDARRVVAAVLALTGATALEIALRAAHPPSASTTLLVALGSFKPTLHAAAVVLTGVLVVGVVGEGFRRIRIRRDSPQAG